MNPPPFTVVQTIPAPIEGTLQLTTNSNGSVSSSVSYGSVLSMGVLLNVADVMYTYYDTINQVWANWMVAYVVNSDCTLYPLVMYPFDPVERIAGMPPQNHKSSTLGLAIAYTNQTVGSFTGYKGSKGILHGPYPSHYAVADVQVTSDSRFAIFTGNDDAGTPLVEVYPIKRDNSLGAETDYPGLGTGVGSNSILVSPDERFLFIGNFASGQITTLNFNKKTGAVSYACSSNVLNCFQTIWGTTEGMATETTTGAGGYLYVTENASGLSANSSIGVLAIDENTGCISEISGSPFENPNAPGSFSIASATFQIIKRLFDDLRSHSAGVAPALLLRNRQFDLIWRSRRAEKMTWPRSKGSFHLWDEDS